MRQTFVKELLQVLCLLCQGLAGIGKGLVERSVIGGLPGIQALGEFPGLLGEGRGLFCCCLGLFRRTVGGIRLGLCPVLLALCGLLGLLCRLLGLLCGLLCLLAGLFSQVELRGIRGCRQFGCRCSLCC